MTCKFTWHPDYRAVFCLLIFPVMIFFPTQPKAASCETMSLSSVVLRIGETARTQIFFDPRLVAGLCADGYVPTDSPLRDLEGLLRAKALRLVPVRKGAYAIMRAETPPSVTARPKPERQPAEPPLEVIVKAHRAPLRQVETGMDLDLISAVDGQQLARSGAVNMASALASLPGVSAYADMGLGQAATGNPEFVSIRGLDTSYNGYALNGVAAPQSDPNNRILSLKMFPASAAYGISVTKTPGVEVEGAATGGMIDIRTPTAFDMNGDVNRLSVQGTFSDLARDAGFDDRAAYVEAEFARRVWDGRLGIYLSGYYGVSHSIAEAGEVFAWVPTLQEQAGLTDYSQVTDLSATGFRYDFYRNAITQYGGTASVVYKWPRASVFVNLVVSEYTDTADDSQMTLRHMLVNTGRNTEGQVLDFWGQPVGPGLPGNAAFAPQQVSQNPDWAVGGTDYDVTGRYNPNGVFAGNYYQFRDQSESLFQIQAGGQKDSDTLSLGFRVAYGYSRQARPDYLEGSSYGMPVEDGRMTIRWVNSYTPDFGFNAAAIDAGLLDPAKATLWKFQGHNSASSDARTTIRLDSVWRPRKGPDKIRAGTVWSRSDRQQYNHYLFGNNGDNLTLLTPEGYATPFWAAQGESVADQDGTYVEKAFLGLPAPLKVFSRTQYLDLARPYFYKSHFAIDPASGNADWPNPGAYTPNDYYGGSVSSRENIWSAWLAGDWRFGDVLVSAGVRYEHTAFTARHWVMDDDTNGHFASVGSSYGEVLPNVSLVWQPDPRFTWRVSVRRSFSRPAISLLTGPTVRSGDVITVSNPDLLASRAVNYDASVSYSGDGNLRASLALFRKNLSHFIYTAAVTSAAPAVNYQETVVDGLILTTPLNGESAWIEGIEVEAGYRFRKLPGALSGLGINANATLQRSEAINGREDHYGRKTWLPRAPRQIYNLDLFWSQGRFRSDILVRHTGLQLYNLTEYNRDNYLQPSTRIDWSVQARFERYTLSLVVKNLTNTPSFWKTFGAGKQYLGVQDGGGNGSYVMTGRMLSLGLETTW